METDEQIPCHRLRVADEEAEDLRVGAKTNEQQATSCRLRKRNLKPQNGIPHQKASKSLAMRHKQQQQQPTSGRHRGDCCNYRRIVSPSRRPIIIMRRATMILLSLCAMMFTSLLVSASLFSSESVNTSATITSRLSSASQMPSQVLASFATPSQAINITHVTYDPLYDTIYLGATNAIYQLNGQDLSEMHEQTTGPVYDNPSCGITECTGYEDFMKPTQNVNKILVIDYQHKKLLSCGSTKQGACRRYALNNITQKEDLISMAVAANDENSSTFAFVAPARYTYDPSFAPATGGNSNINNYINNNQQQQQQQQQVLYVASTYTKVGQSRDLLVPAIGTRILDDGPNLLKLYENSFLDSARIDINSHLRDYFLVNYLYGFASSNYIYFLTVQKKATSRDYEELGYHTRLARICITDSSYNSYTEVDLKCLPNKRKSAAAAAAGARQSNFFAGSATGDHQQQASPVADYPLLQDAILVDAGSHLLQSLAQNDQSADMLYQNPAAAAAGTSDDAKVLLGVFSSARDHTQHAGDHSAICAFSLSQIEEKFSDNIHSCYTGKMQSRNMEYIAGNVQECPKSGQAGNVVNFCHETLKINGTIPIVSEASIQFYNTTLTAITATSHVNSNAANIYSAELGGQASSSSSFVQQQQQPAASSSSSSLPRPASQASGQAQNNQHTVVFAGTSSGHIKKILLNNASAGYEFEDVHLDTNPILGDLHVHASGQQLIAATPYKVMKIPTHNCAQYATCRECSQSRNPYCGWCSLKRSCTTKHECGAETPAVSSSVIPSAGPRAASGANLLVDSAAAASSSNQQQQQQNRQPLKWISNESAGKCIDLQSIVPDKIPITSTGKVDLYIDRLPRLPQGQSYKCIFDRREQTQAQQTSFGLSCQLPKLAHRPKIQPGRDHVNVDLAVRFSETNTDFLNGKVTFFECQLHTTCKDCLTTTWGCNWCLNENICLFNTSKCEKTAAAQPTDRRGELPTLVQLLNGNNKSTATTQSTPMITVVSNQKSATRVLSSMGAPNGLANTISLVNQCPTFDVGHKQDILVADGSERELAIKVKNMPQFKGNIQCIVEIENDKIPLKARIEEGRVICENSTYTYKADVGLLTGHLVVVYSDNNIFIDRTNFTIYKCHLLGAYLSRPDCSLCQRIDARFQCAFCAGSCQYKPRCSERPEDRCPSPRIDFVTPTSGPTLGGTKVTIEGSNLGKSFEEIENRVTIGNVPCRPIEEEYKPSNKIVCITGPVVARYPSAGKRPLGLFGDTGYIQDSSDSLVLGDVMVGNEFGYSMGPTKFQFKSIYLRDHQPRYGPQAGGTRVTLFGMNLNIGSSVQVFLDELPCQIEPSSVTAEQLICRTSASRQASRPIKQLKLIVDDAQIIRDDDVFYYTQDPIVTKISPLRSYLSGGRPINVFGANLTAVQQPKMIILDAAGKKVNESICIIHDDTRMQCPSPAVNLQLMDLEWSEQQIGSYEPQPFSSQQISSTWTPPQGQLAGTTQKTLQHDESVKFKISFIMDSVWRLRDLQSSLPQLNSEIAYTSDPKLYPFASAQYKNAQELFLSSLMASTGSELSFADNANYQLDSDTYLLQPGEPVLVLHGEHLGAAVSEYEITVTVGYDMCNLTQLTHTRLVCAMPLDHMAEPTDEERHPTQRALPLVVVRIGFNLRYELGYVQYHPQLVEQIVQASANSSDQLTALTRSSNYIPSENKSFLQRVSSYIMTTLLLLVYLTLGSIILALVYSGALLGYKLKSGTCFSNDYERIQAKVDSLEKSVKNECRLASLALQSDLNELVRHVELTGTPLLNMKNFIMKVFFPGINDHPLMAANGVQEPQNQGNLLMQQSNQQTIPRPLEPNAATEFPMEYFERLVLTKPFLVTFINTLEEQPNFTIRDKVNVASLIMIILIEKLDYATDILRTLLFQLVQKHVSQNQIGGAYEDQSRQTNRRGGNKSATLNLTRKASNLLGGLPNNLRGSRGSNLGKIVDGGASSLMASTQVAAQMLLSRVGAGNKTSPLQQQHESQYMINSATMGHPNMSTTTFNQRVVNGAYSSSSAAGSRSDQSHLMLRKTDSVVEKMLTNWLALNMYDYFYGDAGQSLYMMFEALKGQLERGPVDAISGDAFYSLNEHKLLREPHIQFELVNLYVIVDTDILQANGRPTRLANNSNNLLLDGSVAAPVYSMDSQSFYEDTMQVRSSANYSTSNTITLALRVLDCDTISQVKSKILGALYRNSAYSSRLGVNDVELSLRQQQPLALHQQTISATSQFVAVTLNDDDYSSLTAFNGMRRINTLRHYGVTDQAIMMLKRNRNVVDATSRVCQSATRTTLTDMLDEHYNNPYSEIQYGPIHRLENSNGQQQTSANQHHFRSSSHTNNQNNGKSWHLTRCDDHPHEQLSNNSSPMSNSPSMMLLGCGGDPAQAPRPQLTTNQQQQQFYHPSSSSTSSGGNVMDTNSTSANSSSMNVGNLLSRGLRQPEQPIYCQIGSVSARSQHGGQMGSSSYYCQIGANQAAGAETMRNHRQQQQQINREQENQIYLSRMLTSKGTIQNYIDDFFKTILSAKPTSGDATNDEPNHFNQVLCGDQTLSSRRLGHMKHQAGACPPAVKWLFDLLDEAAMENGITDQSIIHSWKSNAFLLRFWMNFIKNPNYILDVEKSNTLDASLSTIAQTLMDSCSPSGQQKLSKESSCNKMLFANDVPKYKNLVKRFYQDIASMRPVSDQEIVKRMGSLSVASAGKFDTNLALKELCVYAVNYGVEIMQALNTDYTCQQMNLSQQLEQCFRSFTLFEAYR